MTPAPDDVTGAYAIQLVQLAYLRERYSDRPDERRLEQMRQWISLARGWAQP